MQEKLYTGYYFVSILQKGKLKHIFLVCGESHLVDSIIGHFAQMISATFPFSRSPHIDTSYVFHGLLRGETFLYINQAWRAFLDIFVSKSFTIRVFKRNGHLPSCLNGLTVEVASRNIFPPFPPILTPRTSSWPPHTYSGTNFRGQICLWHIYLKGNFKSTFCLWNPMRSKNML